MVTTSFFCPRVRQLLALRTLRGMSRGLLVSSIAFTIPLVAVGCGKFPLSPPDLECDFESADYQLSESDKKLDVTTRLSAPEDDPSVLLPCGSIATPYYSALVRLDGKDFYDVHVGSHDRFWIISTSTFGGTDEGHRQCRTNTCFAVTDRPDCSSFDSDSNGALGPDLGGQGGQGGQGGECSMDSADYPYEDTIGVSASSVATNFLRVVSSKPISVSFELKLSK